MRAAPGPVCKMGTENAHRSIQVAEAIRHSPRAMAYGLLRAHPREFVLSRRWRISGIPAPGWAGSLAIDTSNGCQNHRLHRTLQRRRLRAVRSLTGLLNPKPALQLLAPDAAASTDPIPLRDDANALPRDRMGRVLK